MSRRNSDDGEVEATNNSAEDETGAVESIHGVGPKYGERLREVGIETIDELADRTASAVDKATEGGVPEGKASNIINKAQKRAILEADVGPDVKEDWGAELQKTRVAVVWPDHYDSRSQDKLLGKVAMAMMECPWDPDVVQLQQGWGPTSTSVKQWVDKQARSGELVGAVNFNPRWQDIPRDAKPSNVQVSLDYEAPEFIPRSARYDDAEIAQQIEDTHDVDVELDENGEFDGAWKQVLMANEISSDWWTVRNTSSIEEVFEVLDGVPQMKREKFENEYATWGGFLDEHDLEIDEEKAEDLNLHYRMAAKRRDEEMLENADGVVILAGDENTEYTRRTAERMEKEVFQFKDGRRDGRTIDGSERTANSGENFDATEDETEGEIGGGDWSEWNEYENDDEGPGGDGDPTSGKKEFTSGQY